MVTTPSASTLMGEMGQWEHRGNLRTLLGRSFQGEAATHPRMEVRQICFRGNIQAEEIEGQC